MPLDRRSLRIIAFRGVTLTITLLIIVAFTAVVLSATGYDETVLRSIINEEVRQYRESLARPGSPYTREQIERLTREYESNLTRLYGLDREWYVRAFSQIPRILRLDFYVTSEEVASAINMRKPLHATEAIAVALPRTILMVTIAYIISALIAVPLGPYIAYKRGSILDKTVVTYAAITNAFPLWWIAMLSIFIFGYYLGVAPNDYRPVGKYLDDLFSNLAGLSPLKIASDFAQSPGVAVSGIVSGVRGTISSFIEIIRFSYMPIAVVVFAVLGGWLYSARAVAIRVVSEDYVMAAKARGLSERIVVNRYVLRVIAGPVLTFVILGLAGSIGGFIITESIFQWPGMGTLFYESITRVDSPMVLALVYVTTLVYVLARFILEILYVILDPRVKL